jgi:hypothetical protein
MNSVIIFPAESHQDSFPEAIKIGEAKTERTLTETVKEGLTMILQHKNSQGQLEATANIIIYLLKLMVEKNGLAFYSDVEDQLESDESNVTISGNVFVLDVLVSKTDGSILKVCLSASQVNSINELANIYLLDVLKNHRMSEFEEALCLIAFLDKGSGHQQLDLFHCLTGLQSDLDMVFKKEL